MQTHASNIMLKSFDFQEGKQVRHADGFQWKMFCFNLLRTKSHWKMQFIGKIAEYMIVKGACLQVFCNDLANF